MLKWRLKSSMFIGWSRDAQQYIACYQYIWYIVLVSKKISILYFGVLFEFDNTNILYWWISQYQYIINVNSHTIQIYCTAGVEYDILRLACPKIGKGQTGARQTNNERRRQTQGQSDKHTLRRMHSTEHDTKCSQYERTQNQQRHFYGLIRLLPLQEMKIRGKQDTYLQCVVNN